MPLWNILPPWLVLGHKTSNLSFKILQLPVPFHSTFYFQEVLLLNLLLNIGSPAVPEVNFLSNLDCFHFYFVPQESHRRAGSAWQPQEREFHFHFSPVGAYLVLPLSLFPSGCVPSPATFTFPQWVRPSTCHFHFSPVGVSLVLPIFQT